MGQMYQALAIVSVSNMAALTLFGGYLLATGHLTAARVQLVAQVLRGELDSFDPHAPASQPAAPTSMPAAAHTDDDESAVPPDLRAVRAAERLESMRLERARRDVEAQRRLLDSALHELITTQEQFGKQQRDAAQQREKLTNLAQDEGFRKELEYVSGLAPKQAKEYLLLTWKKSPPDAARLFSAMETSRGKRILDQMKSPAELETMRALLEEVRLQGGNATTVDSGTSDAAP